MPIGLLTAESYGTIFPTEVPSSQVTCRVGIKIAEATIHLALQPLWLISLWPQIHKVSAIRQEFYLTMIATVPLDPASFSDNSWSPNPVIPPDYPSQRCSLLPSHCFCDLVNPQQCSFPWGVHSVCSVEYSDVYHTLGYKYVQTWIFLASEFGLCFWPAMPCVTMSFRVLCM